MRSRGMLVLATLTLALTGCTSGGQHTQPSCTRLWRTGQQLPLPYTGCRGPAGHVVAPRWHPCPAPGVRITRPTSVVDGYYTWQHRAYAVAGGWVQQVDLERAHPCRVLPAELP